MTKLERYRKLSQKDQDTAFVANVILTQMTNPAAKLRGALTLVEAGYQLRTDSTGALLVGGDYVPWHELELKPDIILHRVRRQIGYVAFSVKNSRRWSERETSDVLHLECVSLRGGVSRDEMIPVLAKIISEQHKTKDVTFQCWCDTYMSSGPTAMVFVRRAGKVVTE